MKVTLRLDYAVTRHLAESRAQPWTSDQDAYIVTHPEVPARELALDLGRTLGAVFQRRRLLRRAPDARVARSADARPR